MRSIAVGMGIQQIGFFCAPSVWEKLKTLMRALINTVGLGRARRVIRLIYSIPLQDDSLQMLSIHHPLVVEGMGGYDIRDPIWVASVIFDQLQVRWGINPPQKPILLVTQGDPHEERGISAITRVLADRLGISRALIFLDPSIAPYHAPNADRYKVVCEIPFFKLVNRLQDGQSGSVLSITECVDAHLGVKNAKRLDGNKNELPNYYRDFALLQEITKVACKDICGHVTIAHTSSDLNEYSVSSFYRVGLDLGLIDRNDMVPFPIEGK